MSTMNAEVQYVLHFIQINKAKNTMQSENNVRQRSPVKFNQNAKCPAKLKKDCIHCNLHPYGTSVKCFDLF